MCKERDCFYHAYVRSIVKLCCITSAHRASQKFPERKKWKDCRINVFTFRHWQLQVIPFGNCTLLIEILLLLYAPLELTFRKLIQHGLKTCFNLSNALVTLPLNCDKYLYYMFLYLWTVQLMVVIQHLWHNVTAVRLGYTSSFKIILCLSYHIIA